MTKPQALNLIALHMKKLNDINDPMELFPWSLLHVIILQIPEKNWEEYVLGAMEQLSEIEIQ